MTIPDVAQLIMLAIVIPTGIVVFGFIVVPWLLMIVSGCKRLRDAFTK